MWAHLVMCVQLHMCLLCVFLNSCLCEYEARLNLAGVLWQFLNECQVCCKKDKKRGGAQCASVWSSTVTDGDGLTYRVLLRSGGFSEAVSAKQVCILKTPPREKANKPRLTYLSGSGGGVSTDMRRLSAYTVLFSLFLTLVQDHCS